MSYIINDETLISELCNDIREIVKELTCVIPNIPEKFQHPLDDDIIGDSGLLSSLLTGTEKIIPYSKADKLDELWSGLLNKSIKCLRFFDTREPFQDNSSKDIVAYGIDNLEEYHRRYTEFEGLMYGANAYYRDHVFHVIRVWMLGVFCLLKPFDGGNAFIEHISLDGGAEIDGTINQLEYVSMWTIAALCHDLGYPLEKADQVLEKTRKMMKEFIPNPNVWDNFGYSGTQDSINEYILKFISTKMKAHESDIKSHVFVGRIQPKYYLKYAKSLEAFQHGIISTVIIFKMLLFFLESDFNLNDDHLYSEEDARQFYIRREILRAIASHTCPDAYNIHITTFSSLLFLCDELQEWGRKTWNELYTGLNENSVSLTIERFTSDSIDVKETIEMKLVEDIASVVRNICRIFERQYSLYKTTFRDGQYTAKRDFDLKKTMTFNLPTNGAQTRSIVVTYILPKAEQCKFEIDLSMVGSDADAYKNKIREEISKKLYGQDLNIVS